MAKYQVSHTISDLDPKDIELYKVYMSMTGLGNISNIQLTEVSDNYIENLKLWVNRVGRPSERL